MFKLLVSHRGKLKSKKFIHPQVIFLNHEDHNGKRSIIKKNIFVYLRDLRGLKKYRVTTRTIKNLVDSHDPQ
jgi:hypothetical protein